MHTNVGTADRVVRIVLALAFFSLFFAASAPIRWLGLIGIVPLGTALAGFCPVYSLLGFNSCRKGA